MRNKIFFLIVMMITCPEALPMDNAKCTLCQTLLSKKFAPTPINISMLEKFAQEPSNKYIKGSLVLVQSTDNQAPWHPAIIEDISDDTEDFVVHLCKDHSKVTAPLYDILPLKTLWSIIWQTKPPNEILYSSYIKLLELFNKPFFQPHVMVQLINPAARILVVGDLHGSARSLRTIIKSLFEQNILNNDLQILGDCTIVFTGDYTDRGERGPQVWHLLSLLKRANPTKVILIRGNHETLKVASENDFLNQMSHSTFCDLDLETCQNLMTRLFNALPLGASIGSRTTPEQPYRFIMFCHGGICPVVRFKKLIQSSVEKWNNGCRTAKFGLPCSSIFSEYLGIMWNDFYANTNITDFPESKPSTRGGTLKQYNSSAAWEYIEEHYSEHPDHSFVVDAIVRGHQHIPGGIAKLLDIQTKNKQSWVALTNNVTEKIRRPSVFTCTSSPEGLGACGCIEDCYAELNFSAENGWQITPHVIQIHIPKELAATLACRKQQSMVAL